MINELLKIQNLAEPILKKAGVKRSAIFGSFARGDNTAKSDVDFLIDFSGDKGLFELIELKDQLEESLGKKVDLITYNSINPLLRERILAEQVILYEER